MNAILVSARLIEVSVRKREVMLPVSPVAVTVELFVLIGGFEMAALPPRLPKLKSVPAILLVLCPGPRHNLKDSKRLIHAN